MRINFFNIVIYIYDIYFQYLQFYFFVVVQLITRFIQLPVNLCSIEYDIKKVLLKIQRFILKELHFKFKHLAKIWLVKICQRKQQKPNKKSLVIKSLYVVSHPTAHTICRVNFLLLYFTQQIHMILFPIKVKT